MISGDQRKKIENFENNIGCNFKNKDLLIQAFVHRSYINENPDFYLNHNERLEFLGDAVLELVVTEYLYKNYDKPEGELTTWRAALVRTERLAQVARELGIEECLLLSKGESQQQGKARQTILANAFEALIGAIYLDQGYQKAKEFIEKNLISYLPEILEKKLYKDAKSLYQEIIQEKYKITPTYQVLKEEGPDHCKKFLVGLFIEDKLIAKGEGYSKQEAEEQAAKKALDQMEKRG